MRLVFLCTHNACRSIMAEAIARTYLASSITVESAGSAPRGVVNPDALQCLKRHHYSIEGLASKSWEAVSTPPDFIITLCDEALGEACPAWLTDALRIHWGMVDPSRLGDPDESERAFNHLVCILENRFKRVAAARVENMTTEARFALFTELGV